MTPVGEPVLGRMTEVGIGETVDGVTAVVVVVVVAGGAKAAQPVGALITLASRVTAPLRAKSRPVTVAPVVAAIEVSAITVPTNVEPVPSVAELTTCQKTLHGFAPLMSDTTLLEPVIKVLAAWNTNDAFGSFWASRITVPVSDIAPALYTPVVSVSPLRSGPVGMTGVRPAASSYAAVRSSCAWAATASATCRVPLLTSAVGSRRRHFLG